MTFIEQDLAILVFVHRHCTNKQNMKVCKEARLDSDLYASV